METLRGSYTNVILFLTPLFYFVVIIVLVNVDFRIAPYICVTSQLLIGKTLWYNGHIMSASECPFRIELAF